MAAFVAVGALLGWFIRSSSLPAVERSHSTALSRDPSMELRAGVLLALLEDRKAAIKVIDSTLWREFGVEPEKAYHLNRRDHTLYELRPNDSDSSEPGLSASLHRRLDDSAENRFVVLAMRKKQLNEERALLDRMLGDEKRLLSDISESRGSGWLEARNAATSGIPSSVTE